MEDTTSTEAAPETRQAFEALAELVHSSADADQVHHAVCRLAPSLVAGCAHASLMLLENGRPRTAAWSDAVAAQVDALEIEVGEGPCLDAILTEQAELVPDMRTGGPWPALAVAVLARTPVRGAAAFRLVIDGQKVGSLNLFADEPGALDDSSAEQGAVLSAFASVALSAVQQRERADTLQRGLVSNREIGKAVGLLMAYYKVTAADAFERLRRTSQDLNIKLVEVARQVVTHHDQC